MTLEELKKIIDNADEDFVEVEEENFTVFFRNSKFKNCVFEKNLVSTVDIKNCIFEKCRFKFLKEEDMYIEMYNSIFNECSFEEIDISANIQISATPNTFNKCIFKNIKLYFIAMEMSLYSYDCKMDNCNITIAEMGYMKWENCELSKCTIRGYMVDNIF